MKTNDSSNPSRRRLMRRAAFAAASAVLGLPLARASAAKLKIGVIGSGRVGGTVGELWVKAGYELMFSSLDLEHDKALAARLVRAFNCVGYASMKSEAYRAGDKLGIPLAGDDPEALRVAVRLVQDAGFDPVVVGGLARAKDFDAGSPIFGKPMTAAEVRRSLGLGA